MFKSLYFAFIIYKAIGFNTVTPSNHPVCCNICI